MATNNNIEPNISTSKGSTTSSSMSNILSILSGAFNINRTPLTDLPPQILAVGGKLRPGLSPRTITARVISRQSEAGAPSGDIFTDSPNTMESMINIIVEEVINAIQLDSKIEITIDPGVQVTTLGAGNLGGPVISKGITTSIASGNGIIR